MLEEFKKSKQTAFIPYLVAGYPSLEDTLRMADILVAQGADVLELGVPYSDALADGPVIQKASESTVETFGSLQQVFELSQVLKKKYPALRLVLFSYFNPLLKMGLPQFAAQAKKAGVDAVLTVDLPPEEAGDYLQCLKAEELGSVFLVSPTTNPKRIPLIAESSTAFIYYVSRIGLTGVQTELSNSLEAELVQLRKLVDKPIVVGFGISSGAQAAQVSSLVEGVVVGSAFVKLMGEPEKALALAREIKLALRSP